MYISIDIYIYKSVYVFLFLYIYIYKNKAIESMSVDEQPSMGNHFDPEFSL